MAFPCKSFIHQFDSDRRLQHSTSMNTAYLLNYKGFPRMVNVEILVKFGEIW